MGGRITKNQLPTPARTQVSYRDCPGPNAQVRCAGQLGNAALVPDQHQEIRQNDGGPGTSQQEERTIKNWWTHIAKVYGMLVCPWISETLLTKALTYEEGQVLPEDHSCQQIVEFFDKLEVKNHERKHPQFPPNVSALLLYISIIG